MKKQLFVVVSIISFLAMSVLVSCNKDEDENPVGVEPINFVQPDSTTIFANSGELVDFALYLALDQAIDTIRAGYLIDTSMMNMSLSLDDMDTIFYVQGFGDSLNVQSVASSFTLPSGINDTMAFRPYFPGSSNPYIAPSYDAVRVVFRLEAEDQSFYEKQLKVIINQ